MNMTPTELPGLLEALRGFAAGTLDRDDYLRACAARADECEPWLKAFVTRVPAADLKAATQGPLAGIPVGVKDIIATAGLRTTNGSAMFADHVPMEDAAVVSAIKRLGGTVFGKTVTTEFAFRHPGATVNPWNPAHTPGGSSSGSAAAVAAGIVPLALGTQTMGSVVRPAAYCGVVGFKASFGAVPREGVHPLSGSLDHVGFMARCVDDIAYALACLGDPGYTLADGTDLAAFRLDPQGGLDPLPAPALAVVCAPGWDKVDAQQKALLEQVAATLRRAGASVEEVVLPEIGAPTLWPLQQILGFEALDIYGDLVARYPDRASARLKGLVDTSRDIARADYVRARRTQRELRAALSTRLSGYDAVLTVPASGEAPLGLDDTGDASWCAPWTFLGFPALSVPAGRSARGLPLGVQLVGTFGRDIATLRVAKWVESVLGQTA
ncbi:amidase [Bordetella genomosp. 9]|uniref:Amidase n=2 Tax=Bordetella genomosp. 9 TaxID=1416803 RepID=A0A261R6F8_9BORD|nr:amidase [Bordetella genomosp. 9]